MSDDRTDEELEQQMVENVDEFFRVLDSIATHPDQWQEEKDDDWDPDEINEIVQLILTREDEPLLRGFEAAGVIETRVRMHYNVPFGRLPIPPEWKHRVPA